MTRALLGALAVCLILAGCGGTQSVQAPLPGGGQHGPGLTATLIRSASGAPSGVRVKWDAPGGGVVGYNLYRDTVALADSEVGSPTHRVANNVPTVAFPGTVSYDDIFPVSVGDEFHYRVSSLDATGDESKLSPESAVTITDFIVTQLLDVTGGVGDSVEIIGEKFGTFDPTGDKVFFQGVFLDPVIGLIPSLIEGTVTDWQLDTISVTVPSGATTGPVTVQCNGLQQQTPEIFTNTDPYITSINPTHGNTDDTVTVTGANFGIVQDSTHNFVFDNDDLPAAQYVSYGPTQIQFNPIALNGAASFGVPLDLHVQVNSKSSNTGKFTIDNRPPVAAVTGNPLDGPTPDTVDLDASGSSDPDNGDSLSFLWDFDNDGTVDFDSGPDPTVSHTYAKSGDFTCVVIVIDLGSNNAQATVDIHASLSRMQLLDNGNFVPGKEFFQPDQTVPINYIIQGGEPSYVVDWYCEGPGFEFHLAKDTDVPYGVNTRQFFIDSGTTTPSPDEETIPAGTWTIRAEAHDGGGGNDPDPIVRWPTFANGAPGTFTVYRYDTLIVVDNQGDPNGTETNFMVQQLRKHNYKVSTKPDAGLTLGDMVGKHVVIWPADGPHGANGLPYEWLSAGDLSLARAYLDSAPGGSLLIAGPPATNGDKPFMTDPTFNDNYVSMDLINQGFPPNFMNCVSFTGGDPNGYAIQRLSLNGPYGGGMLFSPPAGTTHIAQMTYMDSTGVPRVAGDCTVRDDLHWKTYLCPFSFSAVGGIAPPAASVDQLVDNIVAGIADRSQ